MSNDMLDAIIGRAAKRVQVELRAALPKSAARLLDWRLPFHIAKGALLPHSFPIFMLPYWITPPDRFQRDQGFHEDLACSTLHLYLFIRLIDDVADGDDPRAFKGLLPSLTFFHSRFVRELSGHFPVASNFWRRAIEFLDEQADATVSDSLHQTIGLETFLADSARKANAAKIPIAAVVERYGQDEFLVPWCRFVDLLGRIHQLWNDLMGAGRDYRYRARTIVTSRFEDQRNGDETIRAWLGRDGFKWARALLKSWDVEFQCHVDSLANNEARRWALARSISLESDLQRFADRLPRAN
jgi:hypothetical protein